MWMQAGDGIAINIVRCNAEPSVDGGNSSTSTTYKWTLKTILLGNALILDLGLTTMMFLSYSLPAINM